MNKQEKQEYDKQYYLANREKLLNYTKQYRQEHKEQVSLSRKKHRLLNRRLLSNRDKIRKRKLKIEVLTHYGSNSNYPVCIHCGEMRLDCLSIDHISGGGNKEKQRGTNTYYKLKRENYPEGYQTLCMNCQWIKRHTNKEWGGSNLIPDEKFGEDLDA